MAKRWVVQEIVYEKLARYFRKKFLIVMSTTEISFTYVKELNLEKTMILKENTAEFVVDH